VLSKRPSDSIFRSANGQSDPELYSRAHRAASIFNFRLLEILNMTPSKASRESTYTIDSDIRSLLGFVREGSNPSHRYNGLTLEQFTEPPFLLSQVLSQDVVPPPSRIQLDPDQFNLSSFDVEAFQQYYDSLTSSREPLPELNPFEEPTILDKASMFALSLKTGKEQSPSL